jgi:hypothetical protein
MTVKAGAAAPSTNNYLRLLADNMRQCAAQARQGAVHRKLKRGLRIVFARIDGRCRLALGREAPSTPGDEEIRLVCSAFALPDGAEPTLRQAQHAGLTFNVVELIWREVNHDG